MSYRSRRFFWAGAVVAVLVALVGSVLSLGSPVERPARTDYVVLMEIRNAEFHPRKVHLPRGRRSALYIVNRDLQPHTFVVDELGLQVAIPPRRSANILIHPPGAGEFRMYSPDLSNDGGLHATLVVS